MSKRVVVSIYNINEKIELKTKEKEIESRKTLNGYVILKIYFHILNFLILSLLDIKFYLLMDNLKK